MMQRFLLILLIIIHLLFNVLSGLHEDVNGWCEHGASTATTNECICSTHRGFFCMNNVNNEGEEEKCQTGFGMSFFHKSCVTCKCVMSEEWKERKNAFKQTLRYLIYLTLLLHRLFSYPNIFQETTTEIDRF